MIYAVVLLLALIVLAGAWIAFGGQEAPPHRYQSDVWLWRNFRFSQSQKPTDSRFASWEEAFNRPITDGLRLHIEYADKDGVITERAIRPVSFHLTPKRKEVYIRAFCERSREERTFRSDRILSAVNLETSKPIRNVGGYLRHFY